MQQTNTYKILFYVVAIVAVVFIVLYFTKPDQRVSETYADILVDASTCKNDIVAWQTAQAGQETISEESRETLNAILEDCKDIFTESQEML